MPHLHHGAPGSLDSVLLIVIIIFVASVYLRGWLYLRSTSFSTINSWQALSFLVGLSLIWFATASPIATLDHELLTVHMLKHLLLMTLAPPLIWLGEPVGPLLHGFPQRFVQGALVPAFQLLPVHRIGTALGQPEVSWLAAAAALIAWHIPAVFTLAMQSPAWHFVEQSSFLVTGLMFWWPVVQPWPSVVRPDLSMILYLFFATLPCDILSGFLVFCDRVVYPVYLSSLHLFGFSALGDQQCAAALMWTCVTMVYLAAGAILAMRLLSPEKALDTKLVPAVASQRSTGQGSRELGGFLSVATESLATLDLPAAMFTRIARSTVISDYWALTKPEVNLLIVITTFVGFYLARAPGWRDFPFWLSVNALLGTLLVASGTGTLNQYVERRFDAQMRRTVRRPLAGGRLKPAAVLWFGLALSVVGSVYLAIVANILASSLAMATLLSYLLFYTPLKRKTPLCTLVGAFPGAAPPLIGWAAASGRLTFQAWTLYAVLFLWQFPHFMAIAWMYREDYARAGYLVLPPDDHVRAHLVKLQTVLPLLALVLLSLLLGLMGGAKFYLIGALLLNAGFFYYAAQFVLRRSNSAARRLLAASIIYLPTLFVVMVLARG